MRVLFIQRSPFVSFALMSLSSVLKKSGHTVGAIVLAMEKDWVQAVGEFRPDVAAMPCCTGEHTYVLSIADQIKEHHPHVLVVLGGSHPTFCPEIIEHPSVDILARGEAEHAVQEMLERLEQGEDYSDVRNLSIKSSAGLIIHNPLSSLQENLDVLPFPDRHLYDKYGGLLQRSSYWIVPTRGCPYDCTACSHASLKRMYRKVDGEGRYLRLRSPANVIAELKAAKTEWKLNAIGFLAENFTLSPTLWLYPFLDRYEKEVCLPFTCFTRPDLVNEKVISRMKEAGCTGIAMGLESANEEINNVILGRGTSKKDIIDAVDIIHKYGIQLEMYCMLGSPRETLETAFETLEFMQRVRPVFARVAVTQPYPKTALLEYCIQHGLLEEDFHVDNFEGSFFIDNPIRFQDKHEVLRLQKVFGICVKWPFLTPLAKKAIRMKRGEWLFNLLFNLHFAYSAYGFFNYDIREFLKAGVSAKNSFLAKKD